MGYFFQLVLWAITLVSTPYNHFQKSFLACKCFPATNTSLFVQSISEKEEEEKVFLSKDT